MKQGGRGLPPADVKLPCENVEIHHRDKGDDCGILVVRDPIFLTIFNNYFKAAPMATIFVHRDTSPLHQFPLAYTPMPHAGARWDSFTGGTRLVAGVGSGVAYFHQRRTTDAAHNPESWKRSPSPTTAPPFN
jgi:hypothetical protein